MVDSFFIRTFAGSFVIFGKMAFWNKLFGKKEEEQKVGGMEDFMTLIRVYFQAVMAADLHISNLAALPDLRVFKQTLMMLTTNLMKFKLRVPSFFKKAIYTMTEKTVGDIFNKNDFTDASVMKAVVDVRKYNQKLGFSQQWVTNFIYRVVMLAKKEKQPADSDKK